VCGLEHRLEVQRQPHLAGPREHHPLCEASQSQLAFPGNACKVCFFWSLTTDISRTLSPTFLGLRYKDYIEQRKKEYLIIFYAQTAIFF
jgi:hypothetical protein